jgi:PAS domain S-box-containing protein
VKNTKLLPNFIINITVGYRKSALIIMNKVKLHPLQEENTSPELSTNALSALLKEKERLQREYENTEIRFKTVFEESVLGNKFINSNLEIIKVNKALLKLLGYSQKELLGSRIVDIAHPDYLEPWEKLQHMLWIANKHSFSIDTCIIKKDKTILWCRVTSILFKDNGETLGYTIIEDISERKTLELKLEEANFRELEFRQQLLESTIDAQELERLHFAEDLHNSLAQLLYGIKLNLDQIGLEGSEERKESSIAFKKAKDILSKCIKECRRISSELMPSALGYFGLKTAVEDICKQVKESAKIDLNAHIYGLHKRLPKHLEIAIYRIVQELTTNVVKHAAATHASVSLFFKKNEVTIRIEDNGTGFNMAKVHDGSIRIRSVENKIHLLKGNLLISARPGGGTIINVQFSDKGLSQ